MPMMVEPLVFKENQDAGGYMVNGDEEKIMPLVRQAVELGADIIKADPTDDVSQYHRVVEVAGEIPVLVRGGGKVSDEEIIEDQKTNSEDYLRAKASIRRIESLRSLKIPTFDLSLELSKIISSKVFVAKSVSLIKLFKFVI